MNHICGWTRLMEWSLLYKITNETFQGKIHHKFLLIPQIGEALQEMKAQKSAQKAPSIL